MKNLKLLVLSLSLMVPAFSASATDFQGKSHVSTLSSIQTATVMITGDAAKGLYEQFKAWGFTEESPCNDSNLFVQGPGFGCQKAKGEYTCTAILTPTSVSPDSVMCPFPSAGVGNH